VLGPVDATIFLLVILDMLKAEQPSHPFMVTIFSKRRLE
jgi:hypothetical protein